MPSLFGKEKLTVPVELSISKESYDKISALKKSEGSQSIALAINIMCSQFLNAYANGGVLVKPENMEKVEKALGKINSDLDLVEAVQKSRGLEDGLHTLKVSIDPALWPALEEFSKTISLTPEQVMDDIAHRIVRDSFAYYINTQQWEPVIYLTEAQGRKLEKLLGKRKFTGADILALVEQKETVAA
jgi:hypothetical protein